MASSRSARDTALSALDLVRKGWFVEDAVTEALTRDKLRREDAGLATELVYGVARNRSRLDAIIDRLSARSSRPVKPVVRDTLRIALYQLFLLDRIPDHAAVNEAVAAARRRLGPGPAGFVNAVLRAALRDKAAADPAPSDDPESLAEYFSHPRWLVRRWVDELGLAAARAILKHNNSRAEVDLRVNTLKAGVEEVERLLKAEGHAPRSIPGIPHALRLASANGPVNALPGFERGLFAVQEAASQLVAPLLLPRPGHRILDACAAPGGKTAHLAALTGNNAELVAVDVDEARCTGARDNLSRLAARSAEVITGDSGDPACLQGLGLFDRILVDAPCSGLGVLRHNPESKLRVEESQLAALRDRQIRLVSTAARSLRPGGLMVYSVCTVTREETWDVVERFLQRNPGWVIDPLDASEAAGDFATKERGCLTTFPPTGDIPLDGFFAARFRRLQEPN